MHTSQIDDDMKAEVDFAVIPVQSAGDWDKSDTAYKSDDAWNNIVVQIKEQVSHPSYFFR